MILILTATGREMRAALPGSPRLEQGETVRHQAFDREWLLGVTGIGIINAAAVLGRTLALEKVDGVINLGICGSFDTKTLPTGTACAASEEIWPEYGLRDDDGLVDAREIRFGLASVNGGNIFDRIALDPTDTAEQLGIALGSNVACVPSLTVSGVTAGSGGAAAMKERYGVLTENMEGFALALGCAQRSLPFLEVRTVSNRVGSRDEGDWDIPGAFQALGTVTKHLLEA